MPHHQCSRIKIRATTSATSPSSRIKDSATIRCHLIIILRVNDSATTSDTSLHVMKMSWQQVPRNLRVFKMSWQLLPSHQCHVSGSCELKFQRKHPLRQLNQLSPRRPKLVNPDIVTPVHLTRRRYADTYSSAQNKCLVTCQFSQSRQSTRPVTSNVRPSASISHAVSNVAPCTQTLKNHQKMTRESLKQAQNPTGRTKRGKKKKSK